LEWEETKYCLLPDVRIKGICTRSSVYTPETGRESSRSHLSGLTKQHQKPTNYGIQSQEEESLAEMSLFDEDTSFSGYNRQLSKHDHTIHVPFQLPTDFQSNKLMKNEITKVKGF
jgi:hypothetical protein